jgi:uncharacterized protein
VAVVRFVVHNRTRERLVALDVTLADTPRSRRVGLLRHKALEPGQGLWIYPTQMIHTFGMRFPIDVAFLDKHRRIKRVYHALAPFRMTRPVWGARSVLELPAGSLEEIGAAVGDELHFTAVQEAASGSAKTKMKASLAICVIALFGAGCIRRTEVVGPHAALPNGSVRQVLKQQTIGAFDPIVDDSRVQELKEKLKLDPEDIASRLQLASVYESYRLCDEALNHYSDAISLTRSASGADPKMAEAAVLGYARCAQALGRHSEAIALLEDSVREQPAANVLNQLGLFYGVLGNLEAAERSFRDAIAASESDSLHNNLGHNLLLQNQIQAAEAEFRKALALNPKSAIAHNNLGLALARQGDLTGALEEFRQTADDATAHNNLAVVLLEMGKLEDSRDELVQALSIRRYFAPALANFKLVQDRIRERVDSLNASRVNIPQNAGREGTGQQ